MDYAQRLRDLREDLNPKQTQAQVAAKCGISQRKLSFIETGTTEPNLQDLYALCSFYNVSADYIIGLPAMPYPKR